MPRDFAKAVETQCQDLSEAQRQRLITGLEATEKGFGFGFVVKNGIIVCSTCGSNCGQCGDTDVLMTPLIMSEKKKWWEFWK